MLLLQLRFAFQLDDAKKDVGRRTALRCEPTLQIVGSYVESQSYLSFAVVLDHIIDGSSVEISVGHHPEKPASVVP